MIYDWQKHGINPAKAFDADNREIMEEVVTLDTDTGEATVLLRNRKGEHYLDIDGVKVATAQKKYKAPILVVFVE